MMSTPAFDQIRLEGAEDEDADVLPVEIGGYRVQRRCLPIRPGLSIDVLSAADQASVRADAVAKNVDPFGSTVWPSSLAAAIDLCDIANVLRDGTLDGLTVLELGAGTGVASYTAAALGATVIATDVAPLSLQLLEAGARMQVSNHPASPYSSYSSPSSSSSACSLSSSSSSLEESAATPMPVPFRGTLEARGFDVCDESLELPPCDLLVSADMLYSPQLTVAVARRCIEVGEPASVREKWRREEKRKGDLTCFVCVCVVHSLLLALYRTPSHMRQTPPGNDLRNERMNKRTPLLL